MTTPIAIPHETATWVMPAQEAQTQVWMAELYGWRIIRQDKDDATGKVTIVAVRQLRTREWPNVYFGD